MTDDPEVILSSFDSISYDKGASIIRMMANFIGIETFNQGLVAYINKHKFGNAAKVNILYFFEISLFTFNPKNDLIFEYVFLG